VKLYPFSQIQLGVWCAAIGATMVGCAVGTVKASAAMLEPFGDASTVYATGVTVASAAPVLFCSGTPSGKGVGDMKSQAIAAMGTLQATLEKAGFTLDQVVFVRAFLAPDASGAVDYAGWNAAWNTVFNQGTTSWKPARTTVAIPKLGAPGHVIEIEYICAGGSVDQMAAGSEALGLPKTNARLAPYGTKEGRIYSAMGIRPGTALYFASGMVAPAAKEDAAPTSREYRGDMHAQAVGTLKQVERNLASVGLSFKDIVYLHAYAGPDSFEGGTFDLDGWNKGYSEFFNTAENPHKPGRTTIPIMGFGKSTSQLEVEVIAAFPDAPSLFSAADAGNPHLRTYGKPEAQIASGVAVKAGSPLYFSAGTGPTVGGDLKTQGLSALESLKARLAQAGLSFKDVVFLHAYVVPGPDGAFDREGWNAAYLAYFGNADQTHKPARTTFTVYGLPRPDWKIELDVIAAAP